MSLSWRDRVLIRLAPQEAALAFYSRFGRKLRKTMRIACEPVVGTPPWRAPLDCLGEVIRNDKRSINATVIVSNHFTRYLLLPWNPALARQREQKAFAATRFEQTYGIAAKSWHIAITSPAAGKATVAAAVDQDMLKAFLEIFDASSWRLQDVQPLLMAVYNPQSHLVAPNAWIAIAERGRLILGLVRGGAWLSLRSRPLTAEAASLEDLIENERLLLGIEHANETIYLAGDECSGLTIGRLSVQAWQPIMRSEAAA